MNDSILIIDDEVDFLDSVRRGLLSAGLKNLRLESDPASWRLPFKTASTSTWPSSTSRCPGSMESNCFEMIKTNSPRRNASWSQPSTRPGSPWSAPEGGLRLPDKAISRDELVSTLKRAWSAGGSWRSFPSGKRVRSPRSGTKTLCAIITQSEKMIRLLREAELHAGSDVPF